MSSLRKNAISRNRSPLHCSYLWDWHSPGWWALQSCGGLERVASCDNHSHPRREETTYGFSRNQVRTLRRKRQVNLRRLLPSRMIQIREIVHESTHTLPVPEGAASTPTSRIHSRLRAAERVAATGHDSLCREKRSRLFENWPECLAEKWECGPAESDQAAVSGGIPTGTVRTANGLRSGSYSRKGPRTCAARTTGIVAPSRSNFGPTHAAAGRASSITQTAGELTHISESVLRTGSIRNPPMNWLRWLATLPARTLVGVVRIYQWTLGPLISWRGSVCRFHPSCSEYFIQAVEKYGAISGSWKGVRRVLRCHPWHPGGYDPP